MAAQVCPKCGSNRTRVVARDASARNESWLCDGCGTSFTQPTDLREGTAPQVNERVPLRD